jgi:hypothetical protein
MCLIVRRGSRRPENSAVFSFLHPHARNMLSQYYRCKSAFLRSLCAVAGTLNPFGTERPDAALQHYNRSARLAPQLGQALK